jgi:hypothetical protein
MSARQPESDQEKVEYVGAPVEFANAQEMPEWVSAAARLLFFLPAAFVTATTIPILVIAFGLICLVMIVLFVAIL